MKKQVTWLNTCQILSSPNSPTFCNFPHLSKQTNPIVHFWAVDATNQTVTSPCWQDSLQHEHDRLDDFLGKIVTSLAKNIYKTYALNKKVLPSEPTKQKDYWMFLPLHSYPNSWGEKKTAFIGFISSLDSSQFTGGFTGSKVDRFEDVLNSFLKELPLGSHPNPKHPPTNSPTSIFLFGELESTIPTFPLLHSSLSCFASALSKGIFIIKNASAKPWTPKPTGRCRRLERRASTSKVRGIKDVPNVLFC